MRWYTATCVAAAIALGTAALASPLRAELAADNTVGQPDTPKNITVIVANGLGTTVESAMQNAAQNALTQVVGSFVDAETQIKRRTQITDGIRAETRDISKNMREYSQGSIKLFEVLDTQQDGGIVRVAAKVAVQVDVLHAQLKSALAGATTVSKGLFAQAATEQTQQANASEIFIDRVVKPVAENSGVTLTVGAPQKVDFNSLPCDLGPSGPSRCPSDFQSWLHEHQNNKNSIYSLPIVLVVDPATTENLWKTAKEVSKGPCLRIIPQEAYRELYNLMAKQFPDFKRDAMDGIGQNTPRRYLGVMSRTGKSQYADVCYQMIDDAAEYDKSIAMFTRLDFQVSIIGQDEQLLDEYNFYPYSQTDRRCPPPSSCSSKISTAGSPNFAPSFQLHINGFDILNLSRDQTFSMYVELPLSVLKDAKRVVVRLAN